MGFIKHTPEEVEDETSSILNGEFEDGEDDWTTIGVGWSVTGGEAVYDGTPAPEMVTNPSFTGNANGWTLGARLSYSANGVQKTSAASGTIAQNSLIQNIGAVAGRWYWVEVSVNDIPSGEFVFVSLGLHNEDRYRSIGSSENGTTIGVPIRCSETGLNVQIFFSNGSIGSRIEDVSVKDFLFAQNYSFPVDEFAVADRSHLGIAVSGTVGEVEIWEYSNSSSPIATIAAGVQNDFTHSPLVNDLGFVVKPSADFNGGIDLIYAYGIRDIVDPFIQVINFPVVGTYRFRMRIKGQNGEVVVRVGESTIGTYEAGDGMVTQTFEFAGESELSLTPNASFDGTLDDISIKKVLDGGLFGEELVVNGRFNTDTTGWNELD